MLCGNLFVRKIFKDRKILLLFDFEGFFSLSVWGMTITRTSHVKGRMNGIKNFKIYVLFTEIKKNHRALSLSVSMSHTLQGRFVNADAEYQLLSLLYFLHLRSQLWYISYTIRTCLTLIGNENVIDRRLAVWELYVSRSTLRSPDKIEAIKNNIEYRRSLSSVVIKKNCYEIGFKTW